MKNYYSENWRDATEKFKCAGEKFGQIREYTSDGSEFPITVLTIGDGPHKIVINSGMHGLEGYFGSAAMIKWLSDKAKFLSPEFNKKFTIVLVHVINGWGMENRARENANSVDLNRNFRNWDIKPEPNLLYRHGHDLIVSNPYVAPGARSKFLKIVDFYRDHKTDGIYRALSRGQYDYPGGIFYGGAGPEPENDMVTRIYDDVMDGPAVKSLLSIGLHTGVGQFRPAKKILTEKILVSHPTNHPNTKKFVDIFAPDLTIIPDDRAQINAAALSGDLVDYLEERYAHKNIPIWTADMEIGTGTWALSDPTKRMDQGDARWELKNLGRITNKTKRHLTESWYPSSPVWRKMAMDHADTFAKKLGAYMDRVK